MEILRQALQEQCFCGCLWCFCCFVVLTTLSERYCMYLYRRIQVLIVNNKLERQWPIWHYPGETGKNLSQNYWCSERDFNLALPEFPVHYHHHHHHHSFTTSSSSSHAHKQPISRFHESKEVNFLCFVLLWSLTLKSLCSGFVVKTMDCREAFRIRGDGRPFFFSRVQKGYWPDTQRNGTLESLYRLSCVRNVQFLWPNDCLTK